MISFDRVRIWSIARNGQSLLDGLTCKKRVCLGRRSLRLSDRFCNAAKLNLEMSTNLLAISGKYKGPGWTATSLATCEKRSKADDGPGEWRGQTPSCTELHCRWQMATSGGGPGRTATSLATCQKCSKDKMWKSRYEEALSVLMVADGHERWRSCEVHGLQISRRTRCGVSL